MNLALRGIDADLGPHGATRSPTTNTPTSSRLRPRQSTVQHRTGAANSRDDPRWTYGVPPAGNANFAWIQHFLHHLAPTGHADFVLANGSLSSQQSGEGEIRQNLVEADLVECIVALPSQLFYTTQIPVCLWFLTKDKRNVKSAPRPPGRGAVHRRPQDRLDGLPHPQRVHRRRHRPDRRHLPLLARRTRPPRLRGHSRVLPAATLDTIREHNHVLTPGRYVGAADIEDDGEPLDEKMRVLRRPCVSRWPRPNSSTRVIEANLRELGFGG